MKKLFVLFLLVSLVPALVGCSVWGGDDDDTVAPVPAVEPLSPSEVDTANSGKVFGTVELSEATSAAPAQLVDPADTTGATALTAATLTAPVTLALAKGQPATWAAAIKVGGTLVANYSNTNQGPLSVDASGNVTFDPTALTNPLPAGVYEITGTVDGSAFTPLYIQL